MCRIAQLAWNNPALVRFLFKLGFAFTLLFTVCIALIRAQPYDDSELRAFLTPPEGCPAPCFMGIRPGVTTMEEAIAVLEQSDADAPINRQTDGRGDLLSINTGYASDHLMRGISIQSNSLNQVDSIYVGTQIRFGDLLLIQGVPSQEEYQYLEGFSRNLETTHYVGMYEAEDYSLEILARCLVNTRVKMLTIPITMILPATNAENLVPLIITGSNGFRCS